MLAIASAPKRTPKVRSFSSRSWYLIALNSVLKYDPAAVGEAASIKLTDHDLGALASGWRNRDRCLGPRGRGKRFGI